MIHVDLRVSEVYSEYYAALWQYYRQNSKYIICRDKIERSALLLAQRIHSSISAQVKAVGFDSFLNAPKTFQFTRLKAYAEALTADYLSFMQHLSIIRNLHNNAHGLSTPESLFFDNFEAKSFSERPYSQAAGEISLELQAPTNSDTLQEACVTSAFHITYALYCAPDVHHMISSLDVLECYYSNCTHPLAALRK